MKKLLSVLLAVSVISAQTAVLAANGDVISDYGNIVETSEEYAAATAKPEETEAAEGDGEADPEASGAPDILEDKLDNTVQYQAYEMIAGYVAERYLDDSYTRI